MKCVLWDRGCLNGAYMRMKKVVVCGLASVVGEDWRNDTALAVKEALFTNGIKVQRKLSSP